MYSKLAFKNLKRSFKDYTIYFLTLVFGVCIFYTFNSIESQGIMMELSQNQIDAFDLIDNFMGIASVFISFILGFLIIYANNYLIKRRKKEFGIYMTLGMEKGYLSRIIFVETLLIGIISLILGLILGTLLSQGLSVVTAKLFKVDLVRFTFIFSYSAFLKTVACFGGIYLIVLLFNSIVISKVELIELLTSGKKNEKVKVKNIWVSVVIFILSIAMLGYAYYIVLDKGIATIGFNIDLMSVVLGVIGTILFFFSLTGFLLKLVQSNKRYYLRDLNMFVLRQINSKINTTFISMSFICLMLFISICTFSGGMGINKAFNADIEELTKFDITLWNYSEMPVEEFFRSNGIDLKDYASSYAAYTKYDSNVTYKDLLSEEGIEKGKNHYPIYTNQSIEVITLSSYNEVLRMLGEEEISLGEDKYTLFGDINEIMVFIEEAIDSNKEIEINGVKLTPEKIKSKNIVIYNQMMKMNICTIVADDSLVEGLKAKNCYFNMNYNENGEEFKNILKMGLGKLGNNLDKAPTHISKEDTRDTSAGLGAMMSYLAIYMGSIFLITSAAVLALQQLSESTDNVERYKLLKKIGVDEKVINRSLLMQISIYFMMPLALALVHSVVGLIIASHLVSVLASSVSIVGNILVTAVIMVIIYGGYFVATYLGAKKNIRQ